MIHNSKVHYEKAICPCCGKNIYVRYQQEPQMQILGLVDSNGVITNAKSNPDIDTIYNFWNSQDIVVHRNLTPDIKRAIKAELNNYSEAEIIQAIKNYAEIQKEEQYWFKYAWTLRDFLKRGIPKFLDLEVAKGNYSNPNYKPNHTQQVYSKMHCLKCKLQDETWKLGKYHGVCPECGGRLIYGAREQML